jgi:hypothetical protein
VQLDLVFQQIDLFRAPLEVALQLREGVRRDRTWSPCRTSDHLAGFRAETARAMPILELSMRGAFERIPSFGRLDATEHCAMVGQDALAHWAEQLWRRRVRI